MQKLELRIALLVGLLVLIGINMMPSVGSLSPMHLTEQVKIMPLRPRGDNFTINGTMGENGWYRSGVWISITFDSNYTAAVYYKLNYGNWTSYVGPFYVGDDGKHTLVFYYIDYRGHITDVFGPYWFGIDSTAPISMLTKDRIGRNIYRIGNEVSDATSGVSKVEFYLNECLMHTDDYAPYEWVYKGPSFKLDAIVYDNAGNSGMAPTQPDLNSYFAIGFIENPQISDYYATFYAKFVIVDEHYFPWHHHVSTLSNQPFAIPGDYTGSINEQFIVIKYHGEYETRKCLTTEI